MQLGGVRPFFSNKFDITKHRQYRLLSNFDDKNALDIEKYVCRRSSIVEKCRFQKILREF